MRESKKSRITSSISNSSSEQESEKKIMQKYDKLYEYQTDRKIRQQPKKKYLTEYSDQEQKLSSITSIHQFQNSFLPTVECLLWQIQSASQSKYLAKFKNKSYLNCKWLTERELNQNYFFQLKLPAIKSMKKNIKKTTNMKLKQHEFFNPNYVIVDRILLSTQIFAAIHHRKANDIKGKWNQSIVVVCNKLLNFIKDDFPYGIQLIKQSNFIQSRNSAKITMNGIKNKKLNLVQVLNKIYLDCYHSYNQFWHQLGIALQNNFQANKQCNRQKISQILKQCTIFLYKQWYILSLQRFQKLKNMECQQLYQSGFNQFQLFTISLCKQNIFLTQKCVQKPKNNDQLNILNPGPFSFKWLQNVVQNNYFYRSITKQDMKLLSLNFEIDELYLVKWRDLGYKKSTWERKQKIDCQHKVEQFKNINKMPSKQIRDQQQVNINIHNTLLKHKAATIMLNKVDSSIAAMAKKIYWLGKKTFPQPKVYTQSQIYKNYKQLKKFQIQSLNWMIKNWYENRNTILADQMGLGKTIQVIAFLHHLYTYENVLGPFLILAPLTTLPQWKKEIQDWTHFNCLLYYDQDGFKARNIIREHEFYYKHVTKQGQIVGSTINKFTILLTNYEIFSSDFQVLSQIPFQHIILDQAHRLKNSNSKIAVILKQLPCVRKTLLTGTPIQNNTRQLWALLNFIQPLTFTSQELFISSYGTLNTQEEVKEFKRMLKPYMLRRVKEDVQTTIPRLSEIIVQVEMSKIQREYYQSILEDNKRDILKKLSFSNTAMQLRKCCNHPYLVSQTYDSDMIIGASGKLILVMKLLQKFKKQGKKVLIFSQFVTLLQFLQPTISNEGYVCEILTGRQGAIQRHQAITRFNSNEHNVDVFLISTKAGGVGINLISATEIIIYDSDWNPQNDIQATARAHRIGQKKEVTVYRLITAHSYQSEMFKLSSKKLGLDKAVFSGECFKSAGEFIQQDNHLSKKQIQTLLKKGVLGFLQNQGDGDAFHQQSIQQILSKNSRRIQYQLNDKSCAFSKTKFEEKQFKDAIVNDKNFWQTALSKIQTPLERITKKRHELKSYKNESAQQQLMIEIYHTVVSFIKQKTDAVGVNLEDENNLLLLLKAVSEERSFLRYLRNVANKLLEQVEKPSRRFKVKLQDILQSSEISNNQKHQSNSVFKESSLSSHKSENKQIKRKKDKKHKKHKIELKEHQNKDQFQNLKKREKRKYNYSNNKRQQNKAIDQLKQTEKKQLPIISKLHQKQQQQLQEQKVANDRQQRSINNLANRCCARCYLPKCTYFCSGKCDRSFHIMCWSNPNDKPQMQAIQLAESGLSLKEWSASLIRNETCCDCNNGYLCCSICKRIDNNLEKCSFSCNKFYHLQCLYINEAKFGDKKGRLNSRVSAESKWKCPHHICQGCGGNTIQNRNAIGCVRCYKAYHVECGDVVELAGRKIICRKHIQGDVENLKVQYKVMTVGKHYHRKIKNNNKEQASTPNNGSIKNLSQQNNTQKHSESGEEIYENILQEVNSNQSIDQQKLILQQILDNEKNSLQKIQDKQVTNSGQ